MTPEGKAENLYELCEQVCEAIALEHGAYNQRNWISSGIGSCQTAYCRAGWMVSLACDRSKPLKTSLGDLMFVSSEAYAMLKSAGIPKDEIDRLFYAYGCGGDVGSERHANDGVKGMRAFMDKFKDQLVAAPVPKLER